MTAVAPDEVDNDAEPAWSDRGDAGFDRFFRSEYHKVVGLALVLSGDRKTAEDLAQEAFAAAWRRWPELETPGVWVRTVVSNKSRSWWRRRFAESKALERLHEDQAHIDRLAPDTEHFWGEVRRLPRRQAQVVALYYLEDLDIRTIAGILGCSESTARVHLARGRKNLGERLEETE